MVHYGLWHSLPDYLILLYLSTFLALSKELLTCMLLTFCDAIEHYYRNSVTVFLYKFLLSLS